MKKFLVLALAIVMALSVVALVACGAEKSEVGEYHYTYTASSGSTTEYGCKVKVTVKNGVITKVDLLDSDYVRTSSGWKAQADGGWGMNDGDLGHDAAEAAYANYLAGFKGKTVDEVLAYTVSIKDVDGATANSVGDAPKLAGATQSAARLIRAIQDALNKINAAE